MFSSSASILALSSQRDDFENLLWEQQSERLLFLLSTKSKTDPPPNKSFKTRAYVFTKNADLDRALAE